MRKRSWLSVALGAALSLAPSAIGVAQAPAGAQAPAEPTLKVGEMAPEFSAPGSDGKTHTLAQSRGKQAVVLAWFPKAFTAG